MGAEKFLVALPPVLCGCVAMALGIAISVYLTTAAEISAFDFSAVE
jgi:hypothetical protein